MAKKKKLSNFQHGGILYDHGRKDALSTIAKNIKCSKTTVHDTLKWYTETGFTVPKKRPGPKPIFDEAALEELNQIVIRDAMHHRLTIHEIQALWQREKNQKVSISTLRRALRKCGLRSCVARHKPLISANNKVKRQAWAKDHLNWSTHQWRNVVWSDESVFKQFSQNYNTRVWRTSTEEFDESCLVPTIKHSPSHMFWGCFSWHGLGPIIPIRGRMNGEAYVKLLRRHAIPVVCQLVPDGQGIFQQDNAPAHTCSKVKNVFRNANIPVLPWPAQSPDMNPIENMWQEVERCLRNFPDNPTSIQDLEEKVKAAWYSIPPSYYRRVINSMPRRVEACDDVDGGSTRY
ncbi:13745_t:CDS:1 [Dentiscutata heterogama]|uniref:13745_t:CDS:1 n=1 Tax=Dentiscutata heterogama TaxID=1316150 RepID=A0ACA9NJ50_9GLOM|nr:13745_t:CDS:1 [Dentiscutata heterogama]